MSIVSESVRQSLSTFGTITTYTAPINSMYKVNLYASVIPSKNAGGIFVIVEWSDRVHPVLEESYSLSYSSPAGYQWQQGNYLQYLSVCLPIKLQSGATVTIITKDQEGNTAAPSGSSYDISCFIELV